MLSPAAAEGKERPKDLGPARSIEDRVSLTPSAIPHWQVPRLSGRLFLASEPDAYLGRTRRPRRTGPAS
jgi:hypothetical protein